MDQLAANTEFTSSLVRFGLCSQERAEGLALEASARWMPLGKILVRKKKLTIKQSVAVFERQADHRHELFGEIAIQLGFCSKDDIDDAIASQRRECPHVMDLVLASEDYDRQDLLAAAVDYIRYTERLIAQLEAITSRSAKLGRGLG